MRFAQRWGRLAAVAFLLLGMTGCSVLPFGAGEIRFTYADLNTRFAKRFPMDKSVAGLLDVTLTKPSLSSREAGSGTRLTASFDLQVKLTLSGKSVAGNMVLSGRPRYDPKLRAIFLDDARVDAIHTDNLSDALSEALAKAASSVARDALEQRALYSFSPEELRKYGMSFSPKRIEVRAEGIALVL